MNSFPAATIPSRWHFQIHDWLCRVTSPVQGSNHASSQRGFLPGFFDTTGNCCVENNRNTALFFRVLQGDFWYRWTDQFPAMQLTGWRSPRCNRGKGRFSSGSPNRKMSYHPCDDCILGWGVCTPNCTFLNTIFESFQPVQDVFLHQSEPSNVRFLERERGFDPKFGGLHLVEFWHPIGHLRCYRYKGTVKRYRRCSHVSGHPSQKGGCKISVLFVGTERTFFFWISMTKVLALWMDNNWLVSWGLGESPILLAMGFHQCRNFFSLPK